MAHYFKGEGREDEWPLSTPEAQGMDSDFLLRLAARMQASGQDFHGALVLRNGHLVFEAYRYPYRAGTKHMQASCTKAFTSALVGIAIKQGYISGADAKVVDFFPQYQFAHMDGRKKSIRIRHLLSMSSGLDWSQQGDGSHPEAVFLSAADPVQYILDRPMAHAPGKVWNYSGGDSHLLSAIVQQVSGRLPFDFAVEHLFEPLGFSNALWEYHEPTGASIGCAGLYLRPRDMAKLGQLYLNKGKWGKRRILSPEWIRASVRRRAGEDYGYKWWLFPQLGMYKAWGFGGEHIAVFPKLNTVVVFTGGIVDSSVYPLHLELYREIIAAAKGKKAMPKNPPAHHRLQACAAQAAKEPVASPHGGLPATARRVSGQRYDMQANSFGFEWFSLDFSEGRQTATLKGEILFYGFKGTFSVGLDGVYRKKKVAGWKTTLAFRGQWEKGGVFVLDMLNIDFGYRHSFRLRFRGKRVEVEAASVIEQMRETLQGRAS